MYETPITVEGQVIRVLKPGLFEVELPNGKRTCAHLSKELAADDGQPEAGQRVGLEMTPFDFDTARIASIDTAS
ncbi:hypothetical protein HAHE_34640 [Haloferula helveola]|uniref:S1-like domain-containing protein n=1 Tax=Haloferula helveola TaxID=490095 RepID=A0ABM7RG64_9BACT|nr:hypothetical protein HAHE_34640 [Haloferula helveola]